MNRPITSANNQTSSQRAVAAVEVEPLLAKEAEERQLAALKKGNKAGRPPLLKKLSNGNDTSAAAQAAKLIGTNRQYVAVLKKITRGSQQ